MNFNIDNILKLAMIELSEEEKDSLKIDMEKILQWISKLEELEVEGEQITYLSYTPLREDEIRPFFQRKDVIKFSDKDFAFFVVPKVVDK